jgi:hypothetical protein
MTAIIKQTDGLRGKRSKRIRAGVYVFAALFLFAGCGVTVGVGNGSGDDRDNPIHLFEGSFKDGNVAKDSAQWFSFTVTSAGTYYIHVIFGTVEYLNLRVFNRNGSPIDGEVDLWESDNNWYFFRKLPEAGIYRIRVQPYLFGDSGSYRIGYSKTATPPSR